MARRSDVLRMLRASGVILAASVLLGCAPTPDAKPTAVGFAKADVVQRDLVFDTYPASGRTYLSFDHAHGFQVTYVNAGQSWLWYPGNQRAVTAVYKRDIVAGQAAVCWKHQPNSRNPVTGRSGGAFSCEALVFAQKRVVADLRGDVFKLTSGQVPYRSQRCTAPQTFQFDRARFAC